MNEIEKLYENAGIKKEYCSTYEANKQCEGIVDCSECASAEYPPFTAEKQIELIKWLEQYIMCSPFDEGLAKFINAIWQDLTEEEKEALRGILRA